MVGVGGSNPLAPTNFSFKRIVFTPSLNSSPIQRFIFVRDRYSIPFDRQRTERLPVRVILCDDND